MTDPLPDPGLPRGMPEPGHPAAWPYAPQRRAPVGLAVASVAVAIVLTLVEVATAVASGSAEEEFVEALEAGGSTFDVFTPYDGLELLLLPVMVAAWIVSCLWLHFARRNSLVISPRSHHQRGPIWVWLGWWVPVVSVWFPYQVVRDVQDSSRRTGPAAGLGLWWASWLLYLFGNRVTANLATSSDPDTVEMLSLVELLTAVAVVVSCATWCRLVRRITLQQRTALAPSW